MEIADKLYQRATGFEWIEEQAFKLKEVIYENGRRTKETERIEVVALARTAPPETTAGIFWLKNRRKDEWRDKIETGFTNTDGEDVEPVRFYLPSNGRDNIG